MAHCSPRFWTFMDCFRGCPYFGSFAMPQSWGKMGLPDGSIQGLVPTKPQTITCQFHHSIPNVISWQNGRYGKLVKGHAYNKFYVIFGGPIVQITSGPQESLGAMSKGNNMDEWIVFLPLSGRRFHDKRGMRIRFPERACFPESIRSFGTIAFSRRQTVVISVVSKDSFLSRTNGNNQDQFWSTQYEHQPDGLRMPMWRRYDRPCCEAEPQSQCAHGDAAHDAALFSIRILCVFKGKFAGIKDVVRLWSDAGLMQLLVGAWCVDMHWMHVFYVLCTCHVSWRIHLPA